VHLVRDTRGSRNAAVAFLGLARPAAIVAVIAAAALPGCGGESDGAASAGQGVQLSAPINLADCRDWNGGSVEERLGTIEAIRDFTGGSVAGSQGRGRTLTDERAYELFENYCENEFARGFKLYKLYGRAAAFSGENAQP